MSVSSLWRTARRALRGPRDHRTGAILVPADSVLDRLLPDLPAAARTRLLRRLEAEGKRSRTMEELLSLVRAWSVGAGIAEGWGGYPGGTNAPGWSEYVAEQRHLLSVYGANVTSSGAPDEARIGCFRSLETRFAGCD